jgi:hypothetical protein
MTRFGYRDKLKLSLEDSQGGAMPAGWKWKRKRGIGHVFEIHVAAS